MNLHLKLRELLLFVMLAVLLTACGGGGGGGSSGGGGGGGSSGGGGGGGTPTPTPVNNDLDNDGVPNAVDVDDDGDGLIEIRTAAELNAMRHNLAGTGLTMTAGGADDNQGCASNVTNSDLASACNGYELAATIDLRGYENWLPIGGGDTGTFSGTFEGNGRTIRNINIETVNRPDVGLFGRAAAASEFRNLRLSNVTISHSGQEIRSHWYVGALLGRGMSDGSVGVSIHNVGVEDISSISSPNTGRVGGLLGEASHANISFSYARGSSISGNYFVGGLAGRAVNSIISSSYARFDRIPIPWRVVGGLIGGADNSIISSSYAQVAALSGNHLVGGLLGEGPNSMISSSYAQVAELRGGNPVGGLVGNGAGAGISASYALSNDHFHALVGAGDDATALSDSYWLAGNAAPVEHNPSPAPQHLGALVSPTAATGIFATWGDAMCPNAITPAWNFGTADQFPALACFGAANLAAQRTSQAALLDAHSAYIDNAGLMVDQDTPFRIIPAADSIRVRWINPAESNIRGVTIRWQGYNSPSTTTGRNTANDGSVSLTASQFNTSRSAVNSKIITHPSLRADSHYRFFLRFSPGGSDLPAPDPDPDTAGVQAQLLGANENRDELGGSQDPDNDNDGVLNRPDQCDFDEPPFTNVRGWSSNADTDHDGDGCRNDEDPDRDNDGVPNDEDLCQYSIVRFSSPTNDGDRDGCHDMMEDVDPDADGIIQISNAAELNRIRHKLNGRSTAGGCRNDETGTCLGQYILTENIDLGGSDWSPWDPISGCSTSGYPGCNPRGGDPAFVGTFDGQNNIIGNLTIDTSGNGYGGAGLFGVASNSIFRDLILRNVTISNPQFRTSIGALLGYGRSEVNINNVRVQGLTITGTSGTNDIGGLVGAGAVIISSSYVHGATLAGGYNLGGLVGLGGSSQITASYARFDRITGSGSSVGGLVGNGEGARISSSYAQVANLAGSNNVGGLVGAAAGANIGLSYALSVDISATATASPALGPIVGSHNNAGNGGTQLSEAYYLERIRFSPTATNILGTERPTNSSFRFSNVDFCTNGQGAWLHSISNSTVFQFLDCFAADDPMQGASRRTFLRLDRAPAEN